jgi:ABC-type transporter MlaC component
MTDLSAAAIDLLRVLDKKGARQVDQTPELQPLWDIRYVMGNKAKTCITAQGQRFIRAFETEPRH